jgi:protoheme IX farnesyltransferase
MIYSLLLIPVGVIPYFIGMSGIVSQVIVSLANVFMVWKCVQLYRNMNVASARRVMFSSYIYLPIVLLALLGDKMPPSPEGVPGSILNFVYSLSI